MPLTDELRSRLDSTIASNKIVLFMKGTPQQPQCGFSATVISILNNVAPDYDTVDVLADQEIREGIKEYSQWPTIPQLYVDQEFLGGCDVIQQMYTTGQLHQALGVEPVELVTPEITISDTAARAIRNVMAETPGVPVHLSIDADWNHEFSLAPAKGHEVGVTTNGIELLLDVDSARRADGLVIDMTETPQGMSMSIKNPNAPAPAAQMSVEELKAKMDAGEPVHLFDVREKDERERAMIEGSRLLDEEARKFIDSLAKDALLVFHCHTGMRSQSAADFFSRNGYSNAHNLAGGIDAWSQKIDPGVPRY